MDVQHTLKHKRNLSDDPKFHLWFDAVLDNTLLSIMALKAIRDENHHVIDFEYLFLNKKAEESVNRFDLTGKKFLEEFPGGRDSGLFKHYVQVTETDIPWNDEIYYSHDGHEFWSLVKASKLDDGCLVIYEEITQKKKAEQEVLKLKDELASNAEDKYLRLFNSIDQGFCIIEMMYNKAGNPIDYRFLEVNTVFEKQTGLKDAAGKTMREMVPEHEEHWFRIYDEIACTGQPRRFENSAAHLAGGVFYEVYAFRVGKAENKNVAILFSDITERRNQEQNQAFLLKFSDSLRNETTPDTISNRALQMLFEHLKLDCCYIGVFRLQEDFGEFPHQVRNDSMPPLPSGVRLSDFPDALREAFDRTLVIDDIRKSEILSGIDKQNFSALGFGGLVAATLRKGENNPLWSVIVVSAKPRHWLQVEIKLIEEVAERTWAAVERAKVEENFRTLFESIDEGFCIIELIFNEAGKVADFIYLKHNPAFIKHVGLSLEGKRRSELFFDNKDFLLEKYDSLAKTGEPLHFEYSMQSLGGQWFQVTATRIGVEGSKHLGVVFRNITERKHHEQHQSYLLKLSDALRNHTDAAKIQAEAARILGEELKASRAFYFDVERDGEQFFHIISNDYYSRTNMLSVVGRYPQELYWDSIYKNLPLGKNLVINDVTQLSEIRPDELEAYLAFGIRAYICVPLVKDKKYLAAFAVNDDKPRNWTEYEIKLVEETAARTWDAAERAKAEQMLKEINESLLIKKKEAEISYENEKLANVELRRMNEVMDTFVYAAAHDLKAPISNLKLISEVLGITPDPQIRLNIIERISPVVQTLDKTVSGLVNVLAIENGKISEIKEVQFQQILDQILLELKEKVAVIDPELKTDFSRCNAISYIESYIFSIFRNMITNALKYRSDVRKLMIDIRSEMKGNYILLTFIDNGVGIDLEKYGSDLFKPFKRFSSLSEGNGIGLHLIKSIVTKNGGKIEVESELNKGTTFRIYLKPYSK